jgi:hypothetical protein
MRVVPDKKDDKNHASCTHKNMPMKLCQVMMKNKMEALIAMNLNPCCRAMDKLQSYIAQGNKVNETYLREYIYFAQFIHNNCNSDDIPMQATDDMNGCIITWNDIDQLHDDCIQQQHNDCSYNTTPKNPESH